MSEDFSPRYVGDTSRPLHATFTLHDGTIDPLTSASNLTMKFRNTANGTVRTGTGTWTILDAANGIASYAWSSADVAAAGTYKIWPSATMGDGPANWDDTHILEILPIV